MKYPQKHDSPMLWLGDKTRRWKQGCLGGILFFRVGHDEDPEDHLDVWIKNKFQLGDLSRPLGPVFQRMHL